MNETEQFLPNIDPTKPSDVKLVRKAMQNAWVTDIESGRYQAIQKVLSDAALKHPYGNGSREHLKAIALHLKYTQMNIDPHEEEITSTMFFNFVNQQDVDMSMLDDEDTASLPDVQQSISTDNAEVSK